MSIAANFARASTAFIVSAVKVRILAVRPFSPLASAAYWMTRPFPSPAQTCEVSMIFWILAMKRSVALMAPTMPMVTHLSSVLMLSSMAADSRPNKSPI